MNGKGIWGLEIQNLSKGNEIAAINKARDELKLTRSSNRKWKCNGSAEEPKRELELRAPETR